jgi:ribonuclease HII
MLKSSFSENCIEAGVDEAGRGCLAGPVVAAAVILPHAYFHPQLNDSKKLSEKQRNLVGKHIREHALAFATGIVEAAKIDEINILQASLLAMTKAVEALKIRPHLLLIDGNRFLKNYPIQYHCIVKGDSIYASIAAASVIAKTTRDAIMYGLHEQYPCYNWKKNKGYPSREHKNALLKYDSCSQHRQSFRLKNNALQLKLF